MRTLQTRDNNVAVAMGYIGHWSLGLQVSLCHGECSRATVTLEATRIRWEQLRILSVGTALKSVVHVFRLGLIRGDKMCAGLEFEEEIIAVLQRVS